MGVLAVTAVAVSRLVPPRLEAADDICRSLVSGYAVLRSRSGFHLGG